MSDRQTHAAEHAEPSPSVLCAMQQVMRIDSLTIPVPLLETNTNFPLLVLLHLVSMLPSEMLISSWMISHKYIDLEFLIQFRYCMHTCFRLNARRCWVACLDQQTVLQCPYGYHDERLIGYGEYLYSWRRV